MAFSTNLIFLPFLLFLSPLSIHAALGEIVCEHLPNDVCAFSVSSSGKRCLLETMSKQDGTLQYQCRTSGEVEKMAEYIETDQCVKACFAPLLATRNAPTLLNFTSIWPKEREYSCLISVSKNVPILTEP
ncbi:hypothetical protein GBA52_019221 [Prunus armeniaca]|nr:hypothetical protein GBA52_019221 [Prunus armeniaca]